MKRNLGKFVVVLSLTVMFSIGLTNGVLAADKPIELLYATFDPPIGPFSGSMRDWAKDVEVKTNGRVKVKISWAGALGKGTDMFDLCRKGVADAVNLQPGLIPGLFPMSDLISLPWAPIKAENGGKAWIEFVKRGYVDKEYEDVKLHIWWTGDGTPIFFKSGPVRTLGDFKGKKLFSPTVAMTDRIKMMGGVPVHLGSPMDVLPALQKNIIDGVALPALINNVLMLYPHLNSCTEPAVSMAAISIVFNKDYFNKLPSDVQQILDGMAYEHSMNFAKNFDKLNAKSKDAFIKKGGTFVTWSSEAMPEINRIHSSIWEEWIKKTEAKGLPARKAIDDFYKIMKDVGVENPAMGYTPGG